MITTVRRKVRRNSFLSRINFSRPFQMKISASDQCVLSSVINDRVIWLWCGRTNETTRIRGRRRRSRSRPVEIKSSTVDSGKISHWVIEEKKKKKKSKKKKKKKKKKEKKRKYSLSTEIVQHFLPKRFLIIIIIIIIADTWKGPERKFWIISIRVWRNHI